MRKVKNPGTDDGDDEEHVAAGVEDEEQFYNLGPQYKHLKDAPAPEMNRDLPWAVADPHGNLMPGRYAMRGIAEAAVRCHAGAPKKRDWRADCKGYRVMKRDPDGIWRPL